MTFTALWSIIKRFPTHSYIKSQDCNSRTYDLPIKHLKRTRLWLANRDKYVPSLTFSTTGNVESTGGEFFCSLRGPCCLMHGNNTNRWQPSQLERQLAINQRDWLCWYSRAGVRSGVIITYWPMINEQRGDKFSSVVATEMRKIGQSCRF